ncbi:MAG: FdhE protein, partial [Acidobacteriaceae bacterium]|nr:FdhE protein [Acidobacteriaceae bacterium]
MAAKNVASDYDGRIRRAARLAALHPFTQEVLAFYGRIAEFQKSLYARMSSGSKTGGLAKNAPALRQELEIEGFLPQFQEFLKLVAANAPVTLAESARQLSTQPSEAWAGILQDYWATSGRDDRPNAAFDQFLQRAFLQPHAEYLAGDCAGDEAAAYPS